MGGKPADPNVIVAATTPAPVALPPARYALRSRAVPAAVLGLMVGIFVIDYVTPRGMVVGPLYAAPIIVALFSPHWRRNSLLTALIASVFLPIGVLVSSADLVVPWIVVYWNQGIGLLVIWVAWYVGIRAKKAFDTIADSEDHLRISAENLARSNVELEQFAYTLRQSEERFRMMADCAPVLIWISGANKRSTYFNKPWLEFTGHTLEQELDNGWIEGVHPDDLARCLEVFTKAFEAQEPFAMDYRLRRHDGAYRWITDQAVPRFDRLGCFLGYIGSAIDITERKQAEAALRDNEEQLRDFLENAHDLIQSVGADGRFLFVNRAWQDALGYTAEEAARITIFDVIAPEAHEHCRVFFGRILAGEALRVEVPFVTKDGRRVLVEGSANCRFDSDGRPMTTRGIFRDVTDSKKAEEQVRAAQHMLKTVLNNIPQGVFWKDRQSRYLGCNAVVTRSTGVERAELLLGRTDHELPGLTKEQADFFLQKDREVMASGQPQLGIIEQARLPNGDTIWMETSKLPMRDVTGEVVGILGTWQDITERKSLEEQLRQSQKMEAFGQLAGGVAHDFNNLLTVILGFSEVLLMQLPAQDPMRSSLQAISEAGESAASLTRQLLAFSRQTVLETKVFNLNAVVNDTGKMLRRMIGEDVLLTTVLDPKLRSMKADPGQLGQVLMNLAVNSRDAMPKGGKLTIETGNVALDQSYADTHPEVQPGQYVLLAVSDTGSGMTPEVQRRIFEPFFTTKGVGKGTGLGMAVVHGIVKQSGGSIEVYSEPGIGTAFKLYFPVVDEVFAMPTQKSPSEKAERGTETVLLVEDEGSVRSLAQLVLQFHGYTVVAASNGIEAMQTVEKYRGRIDLLVTDVVMPEMDGPDLAGALRSRFVQMKVLFLSGYTNDAVVRHGILHEEVAFLQKPFSPLALARKVREVLNQPGAAARTRRCS